MVVIPVDILGDVAERAEAIRKAEDGIVDLIVRENSSLVEARRRLGYSDLTRPAAAPSGNNDSFENR